jgi:sirohydrochlorin cobaltochelatase
MADGVCGLILFAHGARDPRWAEPFLQLREAILRERPAAKVVLAYLEAQAPDLSSAAATLIAAGCRTLRVVPLFLGRGGHLREDLPQLASALRRAHPDIVVEIMAPIGEDARVAAAIAASCAALIDA